MTEDRIKDLMDKGYITKVVDPTILATMSESELLDKGYITHVGLFDGVDDTTEEVPAEAEVTPAVAMNDDTTTPAVNDEGDDVIPTDEPDVEPDDAPVVDDGEGDTTTPAEEPVAEPDEE